ncbi:MAG: threonine-phosphate decarboxylase CobD [Clostridium sp.]|nr:threonine-phosphate decarboxylase CobD [Clostridium sp.]
MKLTHGGDIYTYKEKFKKEALDYSANINPLGMPKRVKEALIESIDSWVNYPDPLCRELKSDLADNENIKNEYIILGNGAADIIFRLVYTLNPKKAIVLAPTFSEYEEALTSVGCSVQYHYLKEEDVFCLKDDFIDCISDEIDMVFICNPNNPTGELVSIELLEKILIRCKEKKAMLVIDECFNDFIEEPNKYTMKNFLEENKNLFILKAFTKIYAMAGLRLGYGLSSNQMLLNKMASASQPWAVSIPAQIAGVQALKEKEYLKRTEKIIREESKYLREALLKLNMKIYGSKANYIFFRDNDSQELKAYLESKGIMIRDCSNYVGLTKGYYRICIKEHSDNERLINEIISFRGM